MPDIQLILDGEGPMHEQIRKAFARKISVQDLKPGDRLPFEHELMRALKTSRMTVSRALQSLADDGLIERRRKAGSFVAKQMAFQTPVTIQIPRSEVEAGGQAYSYDLLSRARMNMGGNRDSTGRGGKILQLVCRHKADGAPWALEKRWINLDAVPGADLETFDTVPPGEWLLSNVPWNEAEHTISAVSANSETARYLDIDPGMPCLSVERRTWSGEASITHVILIFPGDRKTLSGRYRPGATPESRR